MSDEEEVMEETGAEEAVEEEVVEEEEAPPPPPKREPLPMADDEAGVNEAQAALRAARAKQTEQNDEQIQEYIEMRAELQRKLEEEIEELKEQVAERKIERARDQEEMFERMRIEEDRRKAEEEERRQKQLEDKAKRDALKKKGGMNFNVPKKPNGKNYTIVKKDPEDAAPTAAPVAGGVGPSKEEVAAKKAEHIAALQRQYNFDGMGTEDLKSRIKELHAHICKLEAARYDAEKRLESQDYDMRELEERQKQQARQSALKKGLDAEEAANSKHPPKIQVQSKYDRQIDRRNYGERHTLFDKPAPEKKWKVYHGTPAPPPEWGRRETEELENLRKTMEPRKYQEQVKVEGAKAPVPFKPPVVPEKDAAEAVEGEAAPPAEEPPKDAAKAKA